MSEVRADIYGRHAIGNMQPLKWWQIVGPGHTEGWCAPEDVDPAMEFFDLHCEDDCPGCMCPNGDPPCSHCVHHVSDPRAGLHHVSSIRSPWGNEITNPTAWCRDLLCKSTNWGGHGRLHRRGSDCPPFDLRTVQTASRRQLRVEAGQDAGIKRVNP